MDSLYGRFKNNMRGSLLGETIYPPGVSEEELAKQKIFRTPGRINLPALARAAISGVQDFGNEMADRAATNFRGSTLHGMMYPPKPRRPTQQPPTQQPPMQQPPMQAYDGMGAGEGFSDGYGDGYGDGPAMASVPSQGQPVPYIDYGDQEIRNGLMRQQANEDLIARNNYNLQNTGQMPYITPDNYNFLRSQNAFIDQSASGRRFALPSSVPTEMNSYQAPMGEFYGCATPGGGPQGRLNFATTDPTTYRQHRMGMIPEAGGPARMLPGGSRVTNEYGSRNSGVYVQGPRGLREQAMERLRSQVASLGGDPSAANNYNQLVAMRRRLLPSRADRLRERQLEAGYNQQLRRFALGAQQQFMPQTQQIDAEGNPIPMGDPVSLQRNAMQQLAMLNNQQDQRSALLNSGLARSYNSPPPQPSGGPSFLDILNAGARVKMGMGMY